VGGAAEFVAGCFLVFGTFGLGTAWGVFLIYHGADTAVASVRTLIDQKTHQGTFQYAVSSTFQLLGADEKTATRLTLLTEFGISVVSLFSAFSKANLIGRVGDKVGKWQINVPVDKIVGAAVARALKAAGQSPQLVGAAAKEVALVANPVLSLTIPADKALKFSADLLKAAGAANVIAKGGQFVAVKVEPAQSATKVDCDALYAADIQTCTF
jgi:hypothetical protein